MTSVLEDLPAAAAGLQTYDVIREVDGESTDTPAALRNQIAHTSPGTKVHLKVLRDGRERSFTVELASLEEENVPTAPREPREAEKLGMAVQELTDEVAQRLGLDGENGVLVAQVQRRSAAARAGVRPRDLIVEIDRKPVGSLDEYEEALDAAEGTALLMVHRLTRGGMRTHIVALRLPN